MFKKSHKRLSSQEEREIWELNFAMLHVVQKNNDALFPSHRVHFCFARIAFQTFTRRQILSLPVPRREIISMTKLIMSRNQNKLLHPGKFGVRLIIELCFKFKWNANVTDPLSVFIPTLPNSSTLVDDSHLPTTSVWGQAAWKSWMFLFSICETQLHSINKPKQVNVKKAISWWKQRVFSRGHGGWWL